VTGQPPPDLVDIGANLTHDSFDADRDRVIADAAAAGVHRMILTGSTAECSAGALRLARRASNLWSTAGVHPHHASGYTPDVHAAIGSMLAEPEVVAVGECGLDYFRNFSPADAQRAAFEQQLALAVETGLPVFLHQRDAHEDFMAILRPCRSQITDAVAHCFTGTAKQLADYLELGLYIGITGWVCDERRGGELQDIVGMIPRDRIMIETDAPYLLPRTIRPKPKSRRNEPRYLPEVLRVVAECRGEDPGELAAATTANAERFFRLPTAAA
jgi:TatD DNase family protein